MMGMQHQVSCIIKGVTCTSIGCTLCILVFIIGLLTQPSQAAPRHMKPTLVVRKEVREMTCAEWDRFTNAVNELRRSGVWESFSNLHTNPNVWKVAHSDKRGVSLAFLPWHRAFLRRMERELQRIDPEASIPYWNWALDSEKPLESPVLSDEYFGNTGDPENGFCVGDGAFAVLQVDEERDTCVRRTMPRDPGGFLTLANLKELLVRSSDYAQFIHRMESGPGLHGHLHMFLGGDMARTSSPNDPLFFAHHAFVDMLWWKWQHMHNSLNIPSYKGDPDIRLYPFIETTEDVFSAELMGYTYSNPLQPRSNKDRKVSCFVSEKGGYEDIVSLGHRIWANLPNNASELAKIPRKAPLPNPSLWTGWIRMKEELSTLEEAELEDDLESWAELATAPVVKPKLWEKQDDFGLGLPMEFVLPSYRKEKLCEEENKEEDCFNRFPEELATALKTKLIKDFKKEVKTIEPIAVIDEEESGDQVEIVLTVGTEDEMGQDDSPDVIPVNPPQQERPDGVQDGVQDALDSRPIAANDIDAERDSAADNQESSGATNEGPPEVEETIVTDQENLQDERRDKGKASDKDNARERERMKEKEGTLDEEANKEKVDDRTKESDGEEAKEQTTVENKEEKGSSIDEQKDSGKQNEQVDEEPAANVADALENVLSRNIDPLRDESKSVEEKVDLVLQNVDTGSKAKAKSDSAPDSFESEGDVRGSLGNEEAEATETGGISSAAVSTSSEKNGQKLKAKKKAQRAERGAKGPVISGANAAQQKTQTQETAAEEVMKTKSLAERKVTSRSQTEKQVSKPQEQASSAQTKQRQQQDEKSPPPPPPIVVKVSNSQGKASTMTISDEKEKEKTSDSVQKKGLLESIGERIRKALGSFSAAARQRSTIGSASQASSKSTAQKNQNSKPAATPSSPPSSPAPPSRSNILSSLFGRNSGGSRAFTQLRSSSSSGTSLRSPSPPKATPPPPPPPPPSAAGGILRALRNRFRQRSSPSPSPSSSPSPSPSPSPSSSSRRSRFFQGLRNRLRNRFGSGSSSSNG